MKTLYAQGGNNMYKNYGFKAQEIIVDDDDYEYLKQFKWVVLNGYTVTRDVTWKGKNGKQTVASMHRMIAARMDAGVYEKGIIVKFKDGNRWNCQKDNLFVGRRDNKMNDNFKILEMIRMQINGDRMNIEDDRSVNKMREDILKQEKDKEMIKKYFSPAENDNGEIDITKFKI